MTNDSLDSSKSDEKSVSDSQVVDKIITFDNFDEMNLKSFRDRLFSIIKKGNDSSFRDEEAFSISLDAKFGNGKTTFLKMFENFLEEKEEEYRHEVLFINAWKSDFQGSPVVAILSEFTNLLNKKKDAKELLEEALQILGNLANQSIRNATGFNLKESLERDKYQYFLDEFNNKKKSIEDIRKILKKFTKNKKLIIIVDELDRARPDYAVRFLEDMKHFFNIQNIIFLVAVNKEQMETTVKHLYGENLDFQGYYSKFFNLETNLPSPYDEMLNFIDSYLGQKRIAELRIISFHFTSMFSLFKLSLRDIEIILEKIKKICASESETNQDFHLPFIYNLIFWTCLFHKNKAELDKIKDDNFSVESFKKLIQNMTNQDVESLSSDLKYNLSVVCSSLVVYTKKDAMISQLKKMFGSEMRYLDDIDTYINLWHHAPMVKKCAYPPAQDLIKGISNLKLYSNQIMHTYSIR